MRIVSRTALCALLLVPLAAPAADLTFQVDGMVEYDDNAFRLGGKQDDDVLFRFRPQVKLHEDRGQDLRYSLLYAVPFEFAVDHGKELDDVDHVARGSATYHASDRLELFVSDDFRYLRSALRNVQVDDVLAGEGNFLVNQERERVTLNDAAAGLTYRFTPRLISTARVSHEFFDTDREDRAKNWLLNGLVDMRYLATPRNTLGFGGQVNHQQFGDRLNIPGSRVDAYNAFLLWIFRIDEKTAFSMSAGPSFIDSKQDDPSSNLQVPAIPSIPVAAGPIDNTNLVSPDGSPAPTLLSSNGLIVSQLGGCDPDPLPPGRFVFPQAQGICAIGGVSPPGILIDSVNNVPEFNAATATITITDPAAQGESATSLDVFANVELRRDWTENLHSALRYSRSQGGASGLGGAVIRDTVQFSNLWDFAERWQLALRGDWSLRQSVVDSGVSQYIEATDASGVNFSGTTPAGALALVTVRGGNTNQIDTMRWGVAGRVTRSLTRNTSAWVQLTYNEQTSQSATLGRTSDFDNFLGVVGIRHVFEPIKLW